MQPNRYQSIVFTEAGQTLIEVVMVMVLLSTLAVVGTEQIVSTLNDSRFQTTLQKMTEIRQALVGDTAVTPGASRKSFGYLGDVGSIPTAGQGLAALLANPGIPAWSLDATTRIGAGWKGPYLKAGGSGVDYTVDGWGNAFIYSPAATPPTLKSYGADGVAGGSGYNADIVMQLPTNTTACNADGFIMTGGLQWSGDAQIEYNYPVAGVATSAIVTIVPADKGHFAKTGISPGVRSATIYIPTKAAPTTTVGPVLFNCDQASVVLPTKYTDKGATAPTCADNLLAPSTFTSSGTFPLPANCTNIKIVAKGGGGGSARVSAGTRKPGGAGGQITKTFTAQTPLTSYTYTIGGGGSCTNGTKGSGGYNGGTGGTKSTAATVGANAGGTGGAGGAGAGTGKTGAAGGYGGGGGGGNGASTTRFGGGGGAATTFKNGATLLAVAGGGGGSGTGDLAGSVPGQGGDACSAGGGLNGGAGAAASSTNPGGGGGGGACFCLGGCDFAPSASGAAGGLITGTTTTCAASNIGSKGSITITYW